MSKPNYKLFLEQVKLGLIDIEPAAENRELRAALVDIDKWLSIALAYIPLDGDGHKYCKASLTRCKEVLDAPR
jgi:hypothetical protein